MTPTAGHRITITTRLVASAISQIGEYRHRVTCGCGWCSVETDDVFQANAWRNRGCPTGLHAEALAEFAHVLTNNPSYQLTRDDVAHLPTETLARILGDEVRPLITWAQVISKDELHARAHQDHMDAVHAEALAEYPTTMNAAARDFYRTLVTMYSLEDLTTIILNNHGFVEARRSDGGWIARTGGYRIAVVRDEIHARALAEYTAACP